MSPAPLWPRSLGGKDLTEADERALRSYAEEEERLPTEDVVVDLRSAEVGAGPFGHPAREDVRGEGERPAPVGKPPPG